MTPPPHDDSGVRYVTRDKVEIMIAADRKNYEEMVGWPRHRANLEIQQEQLGLLNKIAGGIMTLKWIGALVTFVSVLLTIALAIVKLHPVP